MSEFTQLRLKRAAEKIAVRDVERAVAKPVIRAGKCNDAAFAVARIAVLSAASTASNPELQKIVLPDFVAPAFEMISAQFLREFGFARVRMHVAHRVKQSRHLFLPGLDDVWVRMTSGGDAERAPSNPDIFSHRRPKHERPWRAPRRSATNRRVQRTHIARFIFPQQLQVFFCFGHDLDFDLRLANTCLTMRKNHQSKS